MRILLIIVGAIITMASIPISVFILTAPREKKTRKISESAQPIDIKSRQVFCNLPKWFGKFTGE